MWDGSFHRVRLRGVGGSILWGYHPAATLRVWTITKGGPGVWHLTATLAAVNAFQIRQSKLLFTAPRDKGLWCWGVESLTVVGLELRAVLGAPEQ